MYVIIGNVFEEGTKVRTESNTDVAAKNIIYNQDEDYHRNEKYKVTTSSIHLNIMKLKFR